MASAPTFLNLCCRSSGSNLNPGSRTGDTTVPGTSADLTYASGTWVNATRVFTVASGDPVSDGVAVNDLVALDTGGSVWAYMGKVSARTSTTITISSTANAGTNPANGTYTLRVGGAMAGPSGTTGHPLNLNYASGMGNVRINLMNDQTYNMTAAISLNTSLLGPIALFGFTSAYDDGGRATMDGGSSGASYNLIVGTNLSQAFKIKDMIFQNNGSTGSADGVSLNHSGSSVDNCLFKNMAGSGLTCGSSAANVFINQSEFYNNNTSNTAALGGLRVSGTGGVFINRCRFGSHSGSNNSGLYANTEVAVMRCIFDANTTGLALPNNSGSLIVSNVFYGNTNHLNITSGALLTAVSVYENNVFENATTVYQASGAAGYIRAFNNGYYNNTNKYSTTGGTLTSFDDINPIDAGSSFLNDPANGDFGTSIAGPGNAAGNGTHPLTQGGYSKSTVGYPDVGIQHYSAADFGQAFWG